MCEALPSATRGRALLMGFGELCRTIRYCEHLFVTGRLWWVAAPAAGVVAIMKLTDDFTLEELIALAVLAAAAMKFLDQQQPTSRPPQLYLSSSRGVPPIIGVPRSPSDVHPFHGAGAQYVFRSGRTFYMIPADLRGPLLFPVRFSPAGAF